MNNLKFAGPCLLLVTLVAARSASAQPTDTATVADVDGASSADAQVQVKDKPSAPEAVSPEEGPKRALNSIYAEGLGAGLVYSINYERLVTEDIGVRAGFSYLGFSASASDGQTTASASASFITIPVSVSYLGVGSKHHILELGGGASMLFASGSASGVGYSASGSGVGVLPEVMVGYRLHPVDGAGFQFRVGTMAFFGKGVGFSDNADSVGVLPWLYLSMGASF